MRDVETESRLHTASHRVRAWFTRNPVISDALLALLVMVLSAASWHVVSRVDPSADPLSYRHVVWLVLGVVPVLIRRVWLWWAVAVTCAVSVGAVFDTAALISASISIIVVAYSVAANRPLKPALAGTLSLWAAVTVSLVWWPTFEMFSTDTASSLLYNYVLATITFSVGRAVHNRRLKLARLEERARVAEANQAVLAAQAVSDERRRIARELHDVVAHHISVMGVLATGARRTLHKAPDTADEALSTIEVTGRATLREMRRLLDVLRSTEESNEEELAPQPSLEAVHSLVAQINDTGMSVNLVIEGDAYPLDSGVALTVYRIVQESLTNTLKHAGPARAGVRIQYKGDGLDVEVADTGVGQTRTTAGNARVGHGLVGMRERVALYGGSLRTGPRPGGGFRVHAVIPIDTSASLASAETGGAT